MDKKISKHLKNLNVKANIRRKSFEETLASIDFKSKDTPEKKLFIDTIEILENIEDTSAQFFDLGVDLSAYETSFFQVIENLFCTLYSETQVNLIHSYIYDVPLSDKAAQPVDKDGKVLVPSTPEELWNAIVILKNK
jgi:hypothetical protein